MKQEIFENGPIACGISANANLVAYTGGVISDPSHALINHVVSVVGWGVNDETEFWIVRNSWGSHWGENGFFRIEMHKNNLRLESECVWAIPSFTKSNGDIILE
jgi:cathepsin X